MSEWLVDPVPCVQRAKPWREPCAVMTSRNETNVKTTRVVYSVERKGTKRQQERWAFGHVAATRDTEGIRLEVGTLGANHTSTSPALLPQHAIYAADALRAAVAQTDGKACAGKSIQELVMEELLTVIDRLMAEGEAEDGRDPGRAEGLAFALAVFQNPYRPNIEAIKEQAMDIWYGENGDE